jgi:hypothetical protein
VSSLKSILPVRRVVTNLAVSAAAFMAVFVAAELTARAIYHPENLDTVIRFDKILGWSLKPGATYRSVDSQGHFSYNIRINSLGLRERPISLVKTAGKRRVLLIGDSVTFGTGVDAGWRFSDFIQRALKDDIEVINAGVPGWGTDQELIYYESFGRRLDPDIVVVTFTMANDVVNNALDHLFLGSAPKPRFAVEADSLLLVGEVPERIGRDRPLWKSVLRQSRFLRFVKRRIDRWVYTRKEHEIHISANEAGGQAGRPTGRETNATAHHVPRGFTHGGDDLTHWSVFEAPPRKEINEAWRVTEAILSRFAMRCREQNAALVVFALPPRIQVDEQWRSYLMKVAGLNPGDLDFVEPFERLSTWCRRNGIDFVHPLEIFSEVAVHRDLYNPKDSHPNRYGHALAARVLLEDLNVTQDLDFEIADSDWRYMDLP